MKAQMAQIRVLTKQALPHGALHTQVIPAQKKIDDIPLNTKPA